MRFVTGSAGTRKRDGGDDFPVVRRALIEVHDRQKVWIETRLISGPNIEHLFPFAAVVFAFAFQRAIVQRRCPPGDSADSHQAKRKKGGRKEDYYRFQESAASVDLAHHDSFLLVS